MSREVFNGYERYVYIMRRKDPDTYVAPLQNRHLNQPASQGQGMPC